MGATNALRAYHLFAGKVPPLAMQVLAYMATVSKDSDEYPWFGQKYEAIARFALGRPEPVTDADLKAVQRAIAPLIKAKAITQERRPARRHDAPWAGRYRLELDRAQPVDISPMRRLEQE